MTATKPVIPTLSIPFSTTGFPVTNRPSIGQRISFQSGTSNGGPDRKIFGYACDRCREKHQSCDHSFPCKRCVKSGVSEFCHYTPKKTRCVVKYRALSSPNLGYNIPMERFH